MGVQEVPPLTKNPTNVEGILVNEGTANRMAQLLNPKPPPP